MMDLLPIIIIVSLLGFFVILTTILVSWQYYKVRRYRKRRAKDFQYVSERSSNVRYATADLTSGLCDTASAQQRFSVSDKSPRCTYFVSCESNGRKRSHAQQQMTTRERTNLLPIFENSRAERQVDRRSSKNTSNSYRGRHSQRTNQPPSLPLSARVSSYGSYTLPRPSLIDVQTRHPSTVKSGDSNPRRLSDQSSEMKESDYWNRNSSILAKQGKRLTSSTAYPDSKSSNVRADLAMTADNNARRMAHDWSNKVPHLEYPRSARIGSPKTTFESVLDPLPFINSEQEEITPRVRFASEADNPSRMSFLSMTTSPSSRTSSEQPSPVPPMVHAFAPPPSKEQLAHYPQPAIVTSELTPGTGRRYSSFLGNTPPHLATPDFGSPIFELPVPSYDNESYERGESALSNRSGLTVASSEIDADWTIGSARAVNIYPSVAPRDDTTPPYAKSLRSKYTRYPKGIRDKALPDLPSSSFRRFQPDAG